MSERRWVAIASSIKTAIQRGELRAGARIASEVEMASQWQVSPVTVHRALSELHREGWVIRRRKFGTVVADRTERPLPKIAVVFPHLGEKPQSSYLAGIERSLASRYQLVPFDSLPQLRDESACLEQAAAECRAIICYPTGIADSIPTFKRIAATIPLVLVDRYPEGVDADTVTTDNYGSVMLGLKHIFEDGHRRIALFMGHNAEISSNHDRRSAYLDFMAQTVGLSDPRRYEMVYPVAYAGWPRYASWTEETLARMLAAPDAPTAIFCPQDAILFAVIEACVHLGVRIPDDITILSIYDSGAELPLTRSVHRLVQRPVELGHMAARRIEQRLGLSTQVPSQRMTLLCDLYPAQAYEPGPMARDFMSRHSAVIEC